MAVPPVDVVRALVAGGRVSDAGSVPFLKACVSPTDLVGGIPRCTIPGRFRR